MSVEAAPAPSEERTVPAPSLAESAVVFLLAAAFVALVGALAVTQNAVSWRAVAAVSHAVDILGQEDSVNLALIGFVEPPLPTLLQLPLAWLMPTLASAGQTVWMFGAVVAGLTMLTLNAACADVGLSRAGRWVFCAVVLLNPIFLGLMATGAPDGLYVFLLLGAGWALLRWQRREALRDLIGCSLFLALATITRYDAVVPALVAALVIAIQTIRTGRRWDKLEGTLITFLLPIVYVAGLWVLANRLIMGDPWGFWRAAWRPPWWGYVPFMGEPILSAALTCVPLLSALWWAAWGGAVGRPRLALGAALMLVSPALLMLLAPRWFCVWVDHTEVSPLPLKPVPDLIAPMLAGSLLLVPAMLGDLVAIFGRKGITRHVCLAGAAALLAFAALYLTEPANRVYVDAQNVLAGRPLGADDATAARIAAARLDVSQPRGTLVVAGWPGYAVTLYAGRVKGKVLLERTLPPDQPLEAPAVGALLVRDRRLSRYADLRGRWEACLGVKLGTAATWTEGNWSYWPAEPLRKR